MGAHLLLPHPAEGALDSDDLAHGQWYRIAQFRSEEDNENAAAAQFIISDGDYARDDFIRLRASVAFGHRSCSLILDEYSAWRDVGLPGALSLARIVLPREEGTGGTHSLQVWGAPGEPAPMSLRIRHERWRNAVSWIPVNFEPVTEQVNPLDIVVQRGLAPTGDWETATYSSSWTTYGGEHAAAGYRMTPASAVELRGLVKGGVVGSVIFGLPVGMRPKHRLLFPSFSANNTLARVDILPNGQVMAVVGNNGFLTLDGIRFLAEQ